ncbi:MAG: DUF454 family protein [Hydrogenobacter sp.]|uniref:DUF454 family protein n=1 Tax=Hydrogenobacter thermophilus TaxID=940 RepID=UPI0030F99271
MKRSIYRLFGFSFLALGTAGIFLPLLPTIPFYLLALLLLARASKRDVVKLKKLPFVGEKIYQYVKKSIRYMKRWNTCMPSSYT